MSTALGLLICSVAMSLKLRIYRSNIITTSFNALTGARYQSDMAAPILLYYRMAYRRSLPSHPQHHHPPEGHPKDSLLFSKPALQSPQNHAVTHNHASIQTSASHSLNPAPSTWPRHSHHSVEAFDRTPPPQPDPPASKRLKPNPPTLPLVVPSVPLPIKSVHTHPPQLVRRLPSASNSTLLPCIRSYPPWPSLSCPCVAGRSP